MKREENSKRKIRYDRIIIFLVAIFLIVMGINYVFNIRISNIYVLNNEMFNDQYILEQALVSDYPSTLKNSSNKIKKRLEENIYIESVKVYKNKFTHLYIEITENKPVFYYEYNNQTVLANGKTTNDKFNVPTVVNYITDGYFEAFVKKMASLDRDILTRISEIKFCPNEVDDNRFLFLMTDGNYVYININTFDKLNKYISIKESLPEETGILYLDYGNNFEILK